MNRWKRQVSTLGAWALSAAMLLTALAIVFSTALLPFLLFACSQEVNYSPPPGRTETAITHYSFGKLVVDGKTFDNDVMILPGRETGIWRMETNHEVHPEDLASVADGTVKTLIIGIGAQKMTTVKETTFTFLKSKGIDCHILDTFEAVRLFNESPKEGLAACFHINC